MCENGATSLPKIFIGGKCIGGAGGFSALTDLVEKDELEVRKINVTLQYMSPLQIRMHEIQCVFSLRIIMKYDLDTKYHQFYFVQTLAVN